MISRGLHFGHEVLSFFSILSFNIGFHENRVDDRVGSFQGIYQNFRLVYSLHFYQLVQNLSVLGSELTV